MKRQRFADTAAIDIFAETGFRQFYAEATRQLGGAGTVQLSALFADDKIIAADWGIASRGRYYDLVPSYDSGEWRAYAPGRLLTEWLLRHHLERGDRIFDYGIGDEAYKFDYCNLHTGYWTRTYRQRLKGAAYNRAAIASIGRKIEGPQYPSWRGAEVRAVHSLESRTCSRAHRGAEPCRPGLPCLAP
jgi:CelD/BcsL family acetyltransferase involved in cellulose biosynthesis